MKKWDPGPKSLAELLPGIPKRHQLIVVVVVAAVVVGAMVTLAVLFGPDLFNLVKEALRSLAEEFSD